MTPAEQALRDAALEYHRSPNKGKIAVVPTKPLSNQRDLSLAYSPGVAFPCLAIQENPALAAEYTSRGNLVGVITNGTAVLGLGDIGPLAGKPVMEGKGCLFKKFAGIDVFDIELAERDPDKLVDIIAALEPTLGGVNLEDAGTAARPQPAALSRRLARLGPVHRALVGGPADAGEIRRRVQSPARIRGRSAQSRPDPCRGAALPAAGTSRHPRRSAAPHDFAGKFTPAFRDD